MRRRESRSIAPFATPTPLLPTVAATANITMVGSAVESSRDVIAQAAVLAASSSSSVSIDDSSSQSTDDAFQQQQQLSFAAFARGELAYDSENMRGVQLALLSSIFIGASFIIKKKGLMKAGATGTRAGDGGYAYLRQPLWWVGMATMIGGEFANLAAYAYAPAIVVTPLGASTIIISALLANFFLGESMHSCGVFACVLTVFGSVILVSYAPNEAPLTSVEEIWQLATQPQFLVYCSCVVSLTLFLIYRCAPRHGRTHLLIYVLICSLIGSLSVVSCKALGIALKLTLRGSNQLLKRETFAFTCCVLACVLIQMNYLNKALDTFNTALVSSTYYVCFTTCTITASMIMYKDWEASAGSSITVQVVGFLTLVVGVYILTVTRDSPAGCSAGWRAVLGRSHKLEYQLCEVDEKDPV